MERPLKKAPVERPPLVGRILNKLADALFILVKIIFYKRGKKK